MGERRLHAEREQDDPRHHRQVQVGIEVAREQGPFLAGRFGQPRLGDVDDPVEVRPPQRGGNDDAEQGGRDRARIERDSRGSDADRDDRLSQRDDHDQPVALDEVLR